MRKNGRIAAALSESRALRVVNLFKDQRKGVTSLLEISTPLFSTSATPTICCTLALFHSEDCLACASVASMILDSFDYSTVGDSAFRSPLYLSKKWDTDTEVRIIFAATAMTVMRYAGRISCTKDKHRTPPLPRTGNPIR